jgi:cathepsin L
METLHFLKTGNLVALSEQNLIDCSTSQGNKGCDGGDMGYAFKYVVSNGGIDTEESYPYEAQGPTTCRYDEGTVGSTLSSYKSIAQGSESALQSALATIGSVSVAIDASEMQFYSSGIYAPSSCSSTDLDHGVLAVGYDNTSSSAAYYWVKNSWGPDWGLDGYVKMAMNKDNMCGIATDASIPTAL